MAWFKKGNDEVQPTPVSFDRYANCIEKELELEGTRDPDGDAEFYCTVNRYPTVFTATSKFGLLVGLNMFNCVVPAERREEVLGWVTASNAATHFVTASMVEKEDDQGNKVVYIRLDAPIHCREGLTDKQLKHLTEHSLSGCLMLADRFCEEFLVEPDMSMFN